jgi:hypothetical protein
MPSKVAKEACIVLSDDIENTKTFDLYEEIKQDKPPI